MNENANINERPGKEKGPKSYEIRQIPIGQIKVADFCRRRKYDEEDMALLRQSILKRGLIHCPTVRENADGTFFLTSGSRRFKACKSLGWKTLPCHVKEGNTKEKEVASLTSLAENRARTTPHPVKQARVLQQIKKRTGMTDTQLGEEVGLKQSSVSELLSILDLPKDIQEKIDVTFDSESPSPFKFQFTHAVALAPHIRTNRVNREFEVHELADKTITCRLSSGKLEKLVQLFTGGDYDLLTERLQMLVRKNKYMTPRMVELFLFPERFVEGDGSEAQRLRKRAAELTSEEREHFVVTAVNHRWSEEDIKNRLLKLIKPSIPEPENVNEDKQPSAAEMLRSDISLLIDKLHEGRYQVTSLAESNPDQLPKIRDIASQLVCSLKRFLKTIETVAADTNITPQSNNGNK